MVSVSIRCLICFLCVVFPAAGCGSMQDDLAPSGSDLRSPVIPGSLGATVGQSAPDFTLSDTLGNPVTLSDVVSTVQGVVLYFTMWCGTCDTHMSTMKTFLIPAYPNVRFYAVDYVSGSVADARKAEVDNGYAGSGFTVLADSQQSVSGLYQATMATTVVIDKNGIVRLNEDFKDGQRLQAVLAGL